MAEIRHETVFDTAQQHLGAVYAKALLGATEKAGNSETVMAELDSLVEDVLNALPPLDSVLASPRVPYERKLEILEHAFEGKMTPQLLTFLKVITRRGRFDCLRAIRRAARELYNTMRGRVEVQVRSAETLDAESLALVRDRLRVMLGREVDLQVKVDPELVGGIAVRVGDTVYDGSVANLLLRLRDEIISKTNHRIRVELERFASAD